METTPIGLTTLEFVAGVTKAETDQGLMLLSRCHKLAAKYQVGLVDSLAVFKAELARGMAMTNLMSQVNHPNARGHKLVGRELAKWFLTASGLPSFPGHCD